MNFNLNLSSETYLLSMGPGDIIDIQQNLQEYETCYHQFPLRCLL